MREGIRWIAAVEAYDLALEIGARVSATQQRDAGQAKAGGRGHGRSVVPAG